MRNEAIPETSPDFRQDQVRTHPELVFFSKASIMEVINQYCMTHIYAQSEKELFAILDCSDREAELAIANHQCLS